MLTGIQQRDNRKEQRRELNDKYARDRKIGRWLATEILDDVVSVALHYIVYRARKSAS